MELESILCLLNLIHAYSSMARNRTIWTFDLTGFYSYSKSYCIQQVEQCFMEMCSFSAIWHYDWGSIQGFSRINICYPLYGTRLSWLLYGVQIIGCCWWLSLSCSGIDRLCFLNELFCYSPFYFLLTIVVISCIVTCIDFPNFTYCKLVP